MYGAAVLLSLMATMTTGSIDANNLNVGRTSSISVVTSPGPPTCKLLNVEEGLPLGFKSPQKATVVTVVHQLYVTLDCPSRNFCSIRWLKGYTPVQVNNDIQLDQFNQTLEILRALYSQAGNYTCMVTDGRHTISRTFQLRVIETPWTMEPLPLSADTCINQTAGVGSSAEFFCFFFAGDNSRDVELTWYKRVVSGTWVPVSSLYTKETEYEEVVDYTEKREYSGSGLKETAGKHLYVRQVTEEAYGDYRLEGNNSYGARYTQPLSLTAPPPEPMADLTAVIAATMAVACLLVALVAMAVTWHFVKLDVKIWRKNRFGALEDDDGKTYDAFICYADEDLPFALDIRERLEQADYNVCVGDIDFTPATTLVEEIILALNTSRRCLIVISPDFIRARHSAIQVDVAADQLLHRQIKIVPVVYRAISATDREEMPLLRRILTNVRVVQWDEEAADRSTKQLLVHMPPRRPAVTPPQREGIEERNLLRLSDGNVNGQADGGAPPHLDIAVGCEMNRFLRDIAEMETRHHHANQDQKENALPC